MMSLANPSTLRHERGRGSPRLPAERCGHSPGVLSLGGCGMGPRGRWGCRCLLTRCGPILFGLVLAACTRPAWGQAAPSAPGRTDHYGDFLPAGALSRFGTVRLRHGKPVGAVAVSPDGKVLASLDDRGDLLTWDFATGRPLHRFFVPAGPFGVRQQRLAFSPSGDLLAAAWEKYIDLYEPGSGKQQRCLSHPAEVHALHFSADGRTLASGCADGSIHIWDPATGKEVRAFGGSGKRVSCVALSPDGKTLVANGADFTLECWDVATGKRLRTIELDGLKGKSASPGDGVVCAAFAPDGKALAVGTIMDNWVGGRLYLLDPASGKQLRRFDSRETAVYTVAFSSNGSLLAATRLHAGTVQVWDIASGRQLLGAPRNYSNAVCFTPDSRTLVTGGSGGTVCLWDIGSGKERERPGEHHREIRGIAFAPNGRSVATNSADDTIRLWEAATGRPLALLPQPRDDGPPLARQVWFLPDARTFVCQRDLYVLSVRDVASGREVRTFPPLEVRVQTFAASPDGKLLAVRTLDPISKERWIHLFDPITGRELRRWRDAASPTRRPAAEQLGFNGPLAFSSDGKVLASGCNNLVRQWETATGKELCRLEGHQAQVHRVAFLQGGQLLVTDGGESDRHGHPVDRTNRLWEAATGKQLWVAEEEAADSSWREFSPDGRTCAASARAGLQVWETATGKLLLRFPSPGIWNTCVAFSPEAQRLAAGYSDGTALVWDLSPQEWQPPAVKASPEQLESCWADLAGEDGPRAHRAVYSLAHHGAPALALLRERLKPVAKDHAERLRQRIADFDSDDFRTREQAVRELTRLGPDAVLPLHAALKKNPSVEAKNRIEALLEELHPWYIKDPETLRTVRAIWVLQRMDTPEARAVLDTLAGGAPEARVTQEAQAALRFLDRAPKP
jgi:WD40 repeat protein